MFYNNSINQEKDCKMKTPDYKNEANLYEVYEKSDIKLDDIPLETYPRPNFKRSSYLCLNGKWKFEKKKEKDLPVSYKREILVPYAVESIPSGISERVEIDDYMFYEREIEIPEDFNKGRIFINFLGVDQICEVFINHELVFKHIGGYTPFIVEVNPELKKFLLTLRVQDVTDSSYHQRGKQHLKPKDFWYSSSSGVYMPIFMESTPKEYLKNVFFTPNYDKKTVKIKAISDFYENVEVNINNTIYNIQTNIEKEIELPFFHLWNTDDPFLYDVTLKLKDDIVYSYFGVRKIEIKQVGEYSKLFLNDKEIFLTGLLDQGYYFLGNLTPLTYDDYLNDIKRCKELGFNILRKHIKVESPLFYYYCDKTGMLLIQDFVNGGKPYKFWHVVFPKLFDFRNHSELVDYKYLGREDEEGRKEFDDEMEEWIDYFYNYPSIIIYTIFNEGWGEFDPSIHYKRVKERDPNRLVDTASGWYYCKDTDFYSIHAYDITTRKRKSKLKNQPFLYSEIGGLGYKIDNHAFFEGNFSHYNSKTKEELEKKYIKLFEKNMYKAKEKYGLVGTIYTEVSDCEDEYNGIFTFDRSILKIDESLIKRINERLKKV